MAENINFNNIEKINSSFAVNNSTFTSETNSSEEALTPNMPSVPEYEVRDNDVPVDNLGKISRQMQNSSAYGAEATVLYQSTSKNQTANQAQQKLDNFNSTIAKVNDAIENAKADVAAKTASAQQQASDVNATMSQSVNLENKVNDCESKIPDQGNKVKKANDMLRAFKLEMNREEADKIGGEVRDFYYYVLAARNSPADLSQWFPINLDKLNKKKKEEEDKLNEYKQQLTGAKSELSANNAKLESQTAQLTQTVLGIMSKKTVISMAEQQISMAGKQLQSAKKQVGEIGGNNTLQAKKTSDKKTSGQDDKAAKLEEEINQSDAKKEEVISSITNLDNEINQLTGSGQGFDQTIKAAGENINRIKQKLV